MNVICPVCWLGEKVINYVYVSYNSSRCNRCGHDGNWIDPDFIRDERIERLSKELEEVGDKAYGIKT